MKPVRTKSRVIVDFWDKVVKTEKCWLWQGATVEGGYGTFKWDGQNHYCHRFVLELDGHDLTGMTVLHDCDTPNCVNPSCLKIGTDADNVKDKCDKGRQTRGGTHPMSKISEEQTREVLIMLSMGIYQKTIAAKYGITQSLVSKIKNGVTRSHIKVAP